MNRRGGYGEPGRLIQCGLSLTGGGIKMPRTVNASLIAAALVLAPLTCAAQAQQQSKGPPPLPDGKGRQLVEGVCSSCHALQLISNSSGYTREHWKELIGYMVDLSG